MGERRAAGDVPPGVHGRPAPPPPPLALTEPTVLFDALEPATTATPTDDGYVLDGVKSLVPRGADAELFVVGARLETGANALFLVEAGVDGLEVEADRRWACEPPRSTRLSLTEVRVPAHALLGATTARRTPSACGSRASPGAPWPSAPAQAVLDYVTPYVKEREAFGEPVAHRQSVAFMVADIAIELQAMRLLTYKAAARVAAGKDASREIGLARQLCASKGMKIGLDGVQLLGGHGFVKEHPVERWYRDLRAIGVMEGGVLV